MAYFTREDHQALAGITPSELEHNDRLRPLYEKFARLHDMISSQLRTQNIDIHVHRPRYRSSPVCFESAGTPGHEEALTISYLRSSTQAVLVERLMGREEYASVDRIETRRHPVIELRLSPEHFTMELLLSPDAWWDQQNLAGKLSVRRHRGAIYRLLAGLDAAYCMGFWRGTHLSDMHIDAPKFQYRRILDEWLSTFEPGKDWFRIGIWYEPEADALDEKHISDELMNQFKHLYGLYQQFAWNSDNDFREFYNNGS